MLSCRSDVVTLGDVTQRLSGIKANSIVKLALKTQGLRQTQSIPGLLPRVITSLPHVIITSGALCLMLLLGVGLPHLPAFQHQREPTKSEDPPLHLGTGNPN